MIQKAIIEKLIDLDSEVFIIKIIADLSCFRDSSN